MRVTLTVNGSARGRRRRVGGREPAVRASRAARPAGLQERLRAGRMRARARSTSTASWCARAWSPPVRPQGRDILTVEGLGDGDALGPVQQAFLDAGAVQCGFCTPGLIVATHDLLRQVPRPPTQRSARRWRATCAAAPATRRSSTPSGWRRREGPAGWPRGCRVSDRRPGDRRAPAAPGAPPPGGRTRAWAPRAAPRRHPQGDRRVRFLLRPVDGGHAAGARRCAARTRGPGSGPSTPPARCGLPGVAAVLTHDDVPGPQDFRPGGRRPAGAGHGEVRYQGEPVADRRGRPPGDRPPRGGR